MSVQDVVLFVSSTSGACTPVLKFIGKNQIPVGIVRLDSPEDRQIAATGKYFQIVNVPTLLVIYDDGNLQLFVGQEKIITWFQQIIQKNMQHPQPQYPEPQHPEPVRRPQQKNRQSKKKPVFEEYSSSSEEDSEEEVYEAPKKKKIASIKEKSSKKYKKQNKKKKKPIQFEDDEQEIEFFNEEDSKSPSTGLEVGAGYLEKRTPQMGSIHEIAKQMQKDREDLNYE